jgi:hypothetical protein
MEVNFRYKAKDSDKTIRGIVISTDRWLETEIRIPFTEAEEKLLIIETKMGDEFKNIEHVITAEAKAMGNAIGSLVKRAESFIEEVVEDASKATETSEPTITVAATEAPTIEATDKDDDATIKSAEENTAITESTAAAEPTVESTPETDTVSAESAATPDTIVAEKT